MTLRIHHAIAFLLIVVTSVAKADDWPMLGRDATRNAVSAAKNPPLTWQVKGGVRVVESDQVGDDFKEEKGIRWSGELGSEVIAQPVVSGHLVWVGTNSYQFKDNKHEDASVLICFDDRTGRELYRYVSPRRPEGRNFDWPMSPLGCSPLIEGDRMWFTTNRCETVCMDIGPLRRGEGQPRIVWKVEMHEQLGVNPHGSIMFLTRSCSPASYKDWLYVVTNNGVAGNHVEVPAPDAPSLVCFDKNTGKVVWIDNSPGENILHGQWASPLVVDVDGQTQVVVPQGDGWVRSFDPAGDGRSGSKVLWEFDINPKESRWEHGGRGLRNNILATPVYYEGRVYIASGQEPEHGDGVGRLCCIDPTKRGDISSQLAIDAQDKPLPRRRVQAVLSDTGEKVITNPNSGLVWEFVQGKPKDGEEGDDLPIMHRTVSNVAIANDLVIACDIWGAVHCLDARTGERHWTYDALAAIWANPLIVGDRVYVGDEDGDVSIFRLTKDRDKALPPIEVNMGHFVYAAPIFANDTLYIATRRRLFAIAGDEVDQKQKPEEKPGFSQKQDFWPQWRGPNRDNVSTDTGLLTQWPEGGPPLLWRANGLGEGIASVSIAEGRVLTLGYRDEKEYVTAVSAETGEQLWMTAIGPAVAENRLMRWLGQRTPTVDGDRLYAMRSNGDLVCLRAKDGQELWRKSYPKDFGAKQGYWGICDYPLVDGDKLICTPGGSQAAIVSLDKRTGEVVWKTSIEDTGRSSYVATVASTGGGVGQYVALLGNGLIGVDADEGQILWRYDKIISTIANSVTPIVRGDSILAYNGYRSGRALLKLVRQGDVVKTEEVYFHAGFLDPFQDSTLWLGDDVHTFSNRGILDRYDARTGELVTRKRLASGIASMTHADRHIYLRQSDGTVLLLEATPDDYVEKSRFTIPDHERAIGATNPVVTGGRLWLRDDNRLFCYDVSHDALDRPSLSALITLRPADSPDTARRSTRQPRSIFVPTPHDVVAKMLESAGVKKTDVVYDLGSGDGRIVIAAAKTHGCKAVGYEIDRELAELSRERVKESGVEQLVTIEQKDIFTVDLSGADVIAVYLLPKQLEALLPQLEKLRSGSRIVSHQFAIPGIQQGKTIEVQSDEDGIRHKFHLWTAPLKKS